MEMEQVEGMNRRDFFFAVSGGLVVGRGCSSRPEFPPEEILEIDEDGKVHRPLDDPQYMLSYDPKTRTILSVRVEEGPIK